MKQKMLLGFVLTLLTAVALAVTAYAASVTVKYRVYVYSDEITFRQYDCIPKTTRWASGSKEAAADEGK